MYLYIGNRKADGGIGVCAFNQESGAARLLKNEYKDLGIHVGCICPSPAHSVVYVTDECEELLGFPGGGGGRIFTFRVSAENGSLTLIGELPSFGAKPSYLETDFEGKFLLASNHGGRGVVTVTERDDEGNIRIRTVCDESSVVLFPVMNDGTPGGPADLFRISGSGPRFFQRGPHAHMVKRAPERNFYLVCDKGGDQLYGFSVDSEKGCLCPVFKEPKKTDSGFAPRYAAFHPKKPWVYVNHEAETVLSQYEYGESGEFWLREMIRVLPSERMPTDSLVLSDLCMNQEGDRLYTLLRVVNRLCVFRVEQDTGKLSLLCEKETPGGGRAMAFSSDGRFLAVSYMEEGRVEVYRVGTDGVPEEITAVISQPSPSFLLFYGEKERK